jgi:glycerol uptake facilitator-like aquaporin
VDSSLARWRRPTAEALAAFALVFAGCGAIVANARHGPGAGRRRWQDFWIYLLGPLIGAAAGAFAYQAIRGQQRFAITASSRN